MTLGDRALSRRSPIWWMGAATLAASVAVGCATPPREPAATTGDSPGARLYHQRCGQCHDRYPTHAYSDPEWAGVIARMRVEADLSDAEARAVLEWLVSAN